MDQNSQQQPAPVLEPQTNMGQKKSSKSKLIIGAIIGVVLLGGGLVAAQSFMNSPAKVWERGLSNTSKGIDAFIELSEQPSNGTKVAGSFKVSSPLAADGSVAGQLHGSNGSMTMNISAAGLRIDGEVRAIQAENSENPDIYFKLDGLESIGSLLGLAGGGSGFDFGSVISEINDQWYVVDHTLLDQALASTDDDSTQLTEEDMREISTKLTDVLDEYVFTVDATKAVFEVLEENGKEDFEGTSSQRYKAGVNKENMKAMVQALRDTMKDTKMADVLVQGTDQSYDELTNLDGFFKSVDEADFSNAVADVWVESSGKFIRNVRFYEEYGSTDSSYFDISIPYGGGDVVPLQMKFTLADGTTTGAFAFGADVNHKNADSKFWFDVNMDVDGEQIAANGELNVARSDDMVPVEKPSDAKNVYEILGAFEAFTTPSTIPSGFEDDFQTLTPAELEEFYGDFSQDDLEL